MRHLSIRIGLTNLRHSNHNIIIPIIEIVGIFPLFLMIYIVTEVKDTMMFIILSTITAQPTINMVLQQITLHLEMFILLHPIATAP
jgi:hypothetical protein